MELTTGHQRQIEAIKSEMECPEGFKCQECGFTGFPKVKRLGKLLECLEKEPEPCPFSFGFGYGYFCRCPLNNYVHHLSPE